MSTTKEKILDLLKNSNGSFISGESIARKLFLTRAAVWKSIKALQADGHKIDAVTNKGYRLILDRGKLNPAAIRNAVSECGSCPDDLKIIVYDEVTSTNDLAKRFASENPGVNAVIIASSQTKGRGRRGRSFFSPDSTGIYMSFILHPDIDISIVTHLTCLAAVAICSAIEKTCGISTQIKWVNDIYLNDKKICGILTEGQTSFEDNRLSYVVIGAGINLYAPADGFPDGIKDKAGALFERVYAQSSAGISSANVPSADTSSAGGCIADISTANISSSDSSCDIKNLLAASIIQTFFEYYNSDLEYSFLKEYKSRSMLIGKYIKIIDFGPVKRSSSKQYALVTGIDDKCRLLVQFEDGTTDALSNGEVSVVKY